MYSQLDCKGTGNEPCQAVESPSNETRRATFSEVVRLIAASRERAFQAVNTELIDLYWQVGATITRKLRLQNLRPKDKQVLSWEQLWLILAKAGRRDRLLLMLDMTEALRPSELFALSW